MVDERPLRTVPWAVTYVLAVVAGRQYLLADTGLALFWPAAGFAALWMVWATRQRLVVLHVLVLFAVTGLVNLVLGVALVPALLFGLANVLQGVLYALVSRKVAPHPGATVQVMLVGAACVLASAASAVAGVTGAVAGGADLNALLVGSWIIRNACGTFVVVSAYDAWSAAWPGLRGSELRDVLTTRRRAAAAPECVAALVATAAVTVWVFGMTAPLPLAFVVLAASVWIGSRFSPVVAATHSGVSAVVVVSATFAGLGPFGGIAHLGQRALVVQLFVLLNSFLTQLLAAGVQDRHALLTRALESEAISLEQKATLEAVLEVMHDGLVVVDDRGQFVVRNSAAIAMAAPRDRGPAGQLRSADAYGLTELDGREITPAEMPSALAFAGGRTHNRELLRVDPASGQRTILSVNSSPLTLPDPVRGIRRLAVINTRDVTEHHVQLRELEGFAGVVAHDLRNPIAAVMSWAEVLDEALDDLPVDASRPREALLRVYSTAERAMDLITELLDYASAGNRPLVEADVDLSDLVDGVVLDLTPGRPAFDVVHQDLGWVRGDNALIKQLVTNLLGNSLKYVSQGCTPRIEITTREQDGLTVLEVGDNGVGIAPEHRSRVFDGFFRAPTTGVFPGTGLGLAICARVVERHGGAITAHDNPGTGGTLIRVSLPTRSGATT